MLLPLELKGIQYSYKNLPLSSQTSDCLEILMKCVLHVLYSRVTKNRELECVMILAVDMLSRNSL